MKTQPIRFFHFIQKHLTDHTKPDGDAFSSTIAVTMPNISDLQSAADLVDIQPENYQDLCEENFQEWAIALKKTFSWVERRPFTLWAALEQANQLWGAEQKKHQGSNKVNHRKSLKVDLRRDSNMTRAYSAFSDVIVEDYSDIDTEIDSDLQSLSDGETNVSRMCDFCYKETILDDRAAKILKRLTGDRGFFCVFCVRNGFHTKRKKNVLILSLRGLIGYLYHMAYFGKTPCLYLTQLQDLISQHVLIGQTNPLFIYDQDTYNWFIDFSSVGNTTHKVPVSEIIRTVNEMITAFNPYNNIKDFKSHIFSERFREAIMDWYSQRFRPFNKIVLAPTLTGCACDSREVKKGEHQTTQQKIDVASLRDFYPHNLSLHTRR